MVRMGFSPIEAENMVATIHIVLPGWMHNQIWQEPKKQVFKGYSRGQLPSQGNAQIGIGHVKMVHLA